MGWGLLVRVRRFQLPNKETGLRLNAASAQGPAHLPALKVKDGHLQELGTVPRGYTEEPCPARVHTLSCSLVMVGRKGTNAQKPPAPGSL